jgi:ABC-type multidrug transport system fused ATPase/permease subunit
MAAFGFGFMQVPAGDVARAIQLSLTPVFLLSGVGVLLGLLTARLGRIVDRARDMEKRLFEASSDEEAAELHRDIDVIGRRAWLMNRAITLGTFAALLVAAIVALLFATAFIPVPLGSVIALVFIISMMSLIGALWCFLVEIRIATVSLRFGGRRRAVQVKTSIWKRRGK